MKKKLFVGIDVSKQIVDVSFFYANNANVKEYKQFQNNKAGYYQLISWIKANGGINKENILFCMENTGVYSLMFSMLLKNDNYFVWVENPLQIKSSLGIKRAKNDKIDSQDIALYAYRFQDKAKLFKVPLKIISAMQDLSTYRERLIKTQTLLSQASKELFDNGEDSFDFIQKSTNEIATLIKKQIKGLENKIKSLIKSDKELNKKLKLITSVKGVGPQIAIYLLIHTKGFTAFENIRQLACYCGVAPFEHSSGSSVKRKTRVSQLANKKLKSLLHMGALSAVRYDPELKSFYERRQAEGKHHLCIMNIVKNKLLSRVWAVVKRGEKFMQKEDYQAFKNVA